MEKCSAGKTERWMGPTMHGGLRRKLLPQTAQLTLRRRGALWGTIDYESSGTQCNVFCGCCSVTVLRELVTGKRNRSLYSDSDNANLEQSRESIRRRGNLRVTRQRRCRVRPYQRKSRYRCSFMHKEESCHAVQEPLIKHS